MTGRIALIDYGSGNLRSAEKALARAGADHGLDCAITVTADPDVVAKADRIVLPGVGAFADCMAGLRGIGGMVEALSGAVLTRGAPFLGICVGMQLLAERGLEFGSHPGLGWIKGEVAKLAPAGAALKIPHMGWNTLQICRPHPLLAGIGETAQAYFVHSYALQGAAPEQIVAVTDYGGPVVAMVAKANIAGTQFHPEKSQAVGLTLLANFLRWTP